jgi:GNAT superfamily N-acetyltransferase
MSVHYKFDPVLFKPASKNKLFYKFIDGALNNDNENIFIGYLDDMPVGYIHIYIDHLKENIYSNARSCIHIEQLIITERFRGNGYGKALINHVVETAQKLKINRIEVNTLTVNKETKKFYENMRFQNFIEKMYLNVPYDA